jgi:hypothetical protein
MSNPYPFIQKASGEAVRFDPEKLRLSLSKAGAEEAVIEDIVAEIVKSIASGMSTKRIYQQAFRLLKKRHKPSAARYKLKRAIAELGPSGYPFERFFGSLLTHMGYEVQTGQFIEGHCITHEVDVLADNAHERIAVECKFGNRPGKKVDSKVVLYIHSRIRDLQRAWHRDPVLSQKTIHGWIVTNTGFTSEAIQYGACSGLHLVGWSFPKVGNLKDLIDAARLYPITSLTSLTIKEKKLLLDEGVILCRELLGQETLLRDHHVSESRLRKVQAELEALCG